MTRIQERRLVDSFKRWKSEENWWSKVLRGKHMGSIAQVVKWVMWIYGSGVRYNSISKWTRLYRENVQSEKKQRKMTEFSDNPNSSGSHILTQTEKFFFFFHISVFSWYKRVQTDTWIYFQVPVYCLLSWRFNVCLCRILWVTTFPRRKMCMTHVYHTVS